MSKWYSGKYDLIFKRAVCTPPYNYLKRIIEVSLDQKVLKILEVKVSKEDLTSNIYVKNKILDVSVLTDIGKINIEVNSNVNTYIRERNFNYISNEYSSYTKTGEVYSNKIQFCQINLSWNVEKDRPLKAVYEMIDIKTGLKYIDNFKIIEFNMEKIDKLWYDGNEEEKEKYKTLIALNCSKENLSLISKGDDIMEEYKNKVEYLNTEDDVVNYLNSKEDWEKLDRSIRLGELEEAIQKTTEKVTKQTKLETAKKMLKEKIDTDTILKITGLSKKDLGLN